MGKPKGARLADDLSRLAEKHGYSEEADGDVGVMRFLHTLVGELEAENARLKRELKEAIESFESMKRTALDHSRSHQEYMGQVAELETELNAILAMVNLDKGGPKNET